MHSVLNITPSYILLHIKKHSSYTFLLAFKIMENIQCILSIRSKIWRPSLSKTYYCFPYKNIHAITKIFQRILLPRNIHRIIF